MTSAVTSPLPSTQAPARPYPRPHPARYPVHAVLALYNLVLAAVWLTLAPKSPLAPWIALAHLSGALLPWISLRAHRLPRGLGAVFDVIPAISMALFWSELGVLQALRAAPAHDMAVRRLDLAVFGVHWHDVWMARMPQAWMSELMHFGYFIYYGVLLLPPIGVLLARGGAAFRSATLMVLATYLSCFLFYLAFPVYGPRAAYGVEAGSAPPGIFHALVERARESGDSPGTAFPSSHVAGAVTMAWVAWRFLSRRAAITLSLAAAWITLATVYTRNHYAVDALAGLLWAIPLQGWLVPALERRARRHAA